MQQQRTTCPPAPASSSGVYGRQTCWSGCVAGGRVTQSQSAIDMLRAFGSNADCSHGGHPSCLRVQNHYPNWDEVEVNTKWKIGPLMSPQPPAKGATRGKATSTAFWRGMLTAITQKRHIHAYSATPGAGVTPGRRAMTFYSWHPSATNTAGPGPEIDPRTRQSTLVAGWGLNKVIRRGCSR